MSVGDASNRPSPSVSASREADAVSTYTTFPDSPGLPIAEHIRELKAERDRALAAVTALEREVERLQNQIEQITLHVSPPSDRSSRSIISAFRHRRRAPSSPDEEITPPQNPLFDAQWYVKRYPDLPVDVPAETHWRRQGVFEGFDPNAFFDIAFYRERNPDSLLNGMNPLDHYLLTGAAERQSPSRLFDTAWYLRTYRDVAASGMNPLLHYLRFGRAEGRHPTPTNAATAGAETAAAACDVAAHEGSQTLSRDAIIEKLYPLWPARASEAGPIHPSAASPRVEAAPGGDIASDVRLIAFYSAACHPVVAGARPGRDSTGWLAVAKARPFLPGQTQPHVPADLGFYDLRLPETREDQARLATRYGVHAFCYEQTWQSQSGHGGDFFEMCASGLPDLPFAIRMTLENARTSPPPVPPFSSEWLRANARQLVSVVEALSDDRAVKVGSSPVLIMEGLIGPHASRACDVVRQTAAELGLPGLFIVSAIASSIVGGDARNLGVDAFLALHPSDTVISRLQCSAERLGPEHSRIASYDDYSRAAQNNASSNVLKTVLVGWDDTPLKEDSAIVLTKPTPHRYGAWLRWAIAGAREDLPPDRRLVFIASWNDWPRGAHLEPDIANGHAFLSSTRESLAAALPAADGRLPG